MAATQLVQKQPAQLPPVVSVSFGVVSQIVVGALSGVLAWWLIENVQRRGRGRRR